MLARIEITTPTCGKIRIHLPIRQQAADNNPNHFLFQFGSNNNLVITLNLHERRCLERCVGFAASQQVWQPTEYAKLESKQ